MYELASVAADTTFLLWELQLETLDLAQMVRRMKDLSAYSLEHADIMERREGVELLALGRFFGISGDHPENQARLRGLSEDVLAYPGSAEAVILQIAKREGRE